jgi:anti-anti-sigma factor
MQATMTEIDGVTRVALDGRLDTAGVSAIELTFTAMIVPGGRRAIVDLAAVSFLASLGVRMFISTARAAAGKGGRVVFFAATPAVAEIIDTMGLAEIIDVVGSEAEAMAMVRS